jgi:hypothetical protein
MVIKFNVSLSELPGFLWNKLSNDSQRYVQLLWKRDAGAFVGLKSYRSNIVEQIGFGMLFPLVGLPHKLAVQNKYVAVAVAASACTMFVLKFIANPFETTTLIGRTIAFLPRLPAIFAKLSLFGLFCRSVGRMFNTSLMREFYTPTVK